jgi:hypothetical protein
MVNLESLVSCAQALEWRRGDQKGPPESMQNLRAMTILRLLETQIRALNGGPIHQRLLKLWEAQEFSSGERDSFNEIVTEQLRAVGATSFPTTAEELLETIAAQLEKSRLSPKSQRGSPC